MWPEDTAEEIRRKIAWCETNAIAVFAVHRRAIPQFDEFDATRDRCFLATTPPLPDTRVAATISARVQPPERAGLDKDRAQAAAARRYRFRQ